MLHALPAPTTPTAACPRPSPMTEKRARIPLSTVRTPPFEHDYPPASHCRLRSRFRTIDDVVFEVYDAAVLASGVMTKSIHMARFNARSSTAHHPDVAHVIPNVSADVLETVLRYCYFHASQLCANMTSDQIKAWDNQFAALDPEQLCDLASAAYYLDIKDLIDLTCRAIAALISGKSAEQIRKTFHIENDLANTIDRVLPRVLPRDFYMRGSIRSPNDPSFRVLTMDRHLRKDTRARAKSALSTPDQTTDVSPAIADRSVEELTEWICSGEPSKNSGKRRKNKKKHKTGARRSDSDITDHTLHDSSLALAVKEPLSDGPASSESLLAVGSEIVRIKQEPYSKSASATEQLPEQSGDNPDQLSAEHVDNQTTERRGAVSEVFRMSGKQEDGVISESLPTGRSADQMMEPENQKASASFTGTLVVQSLSESSSGAEGNEMEGFVEGHDDQKGDIALDESDVIEILEDSDSNPAFIDCPDRMDREVEAFKKRLCIGDSPASPPLEAASDPTVGEGGDSESTDEVVFVGEVRAEMQDERSVLEEWAKEEAGLSERREQIEKRVIEIDRQVADLNTERERVRDQLALVNMQLSSLRKRSSRAKSEG